MNDVDFASVELDDPLPFVVRALCPPGPPSSDGTGCRVLRGPAGARRGPRQGRGRSCRGVSSGRPAWCRRRAGSGTVRRASSPARRLSPCARDPTGVRPSWRGSALHGPSVDLVDSGGAGEVGAVQCSDELAQGVCVLDPRFDELGCCCLGAPHSDDAGLPVGRLLGTHGVVELVRCWAPLPAGAAAGESALDSTGVATARRAGRAQSAEVVFGCRAVAEGAWRQQHGRSPGVPFGLAPPAREGAGVEGGKRQHDDSRYRTQQVAS